jgi:hypothetical protein
VAPVLILPLFNRFTPLADGTIATDAVMFAVDGRMGLDVSIETGRREYGPGQRVSLDFAVSDPEGDLDRQHSAGKQELPEQGFSQPLVSKHFAKPLGTNVIGVTRAKDILDRIIHNGHQRYQG